MEIEPTVSVVMSVYNGAETLSATVESVLKQSEVDFEFIVINDGSTDFSGRILDRYAADDERMRVFHQPNRGLTKALIHGCSLARGRFIARQDAGDLSLPHRLSREQAILDKDASVVFVSCWTQFAGPALEPLYVSRGTGRWSAVDTLIDLSAPKCVVDGPTSHPVVMFRRDAYERAGGYRAEFRFGQDWDLWYRLASLGKFRMIEDVLYIARVNPVSISTIDRPAQQQLAAISEELVRARAAGRSEASLLAEASTIKDIRSRGLCARARGNYFIGEALRRNRDVRCRTYLRRAATSCPLLVRAWIRLLQSVVLRDSAYESGPMRG